MNTKFSQRKEQTEIKFNNNRLNFLLAIIFLLFMAIILKLYNVQIINNEKYAKLTGFFCIFAPSNPISNKQQKNTS